MRPAFLASLTLALLLSLPACGDDSAGSGGAGTSTTGSQASGVGGSGGSGGNGDEIPAVEDPFLPAPEPPSLSPDQLAALGAEIDSALAGSTSASRSAMVFGLDSGQVIYAQNADTPRKPASNTKLFTTAAGLYLYGEAHRPEASVYGKAPVGGVVQGDLVLFGQHDPECSTWFSQSSRQPLDAIAEELASAGITRVAGSVVAQGEFVDVGNSLGTIDFAAERIEIAADLRAALLAAGISVDGGSSGAAGLSPPSGLEKLAALPALSQDVLAHAINVPSHNEFADLWLHHLGFLDSNTSTYAAGFTAVVGALDSMQVPHAGLLLNDGSGLSHNNRVTPRHIVDLFSRISTKEQWPAFLHSLAISGVRGTIAGRMGGAETLGRFWGKTGTLTGVIALSGVLFHGYDGQRYLVSVLLNDVSDSASARAASDKVVAAVAKNRKGSDSPLPSTPTLLAARDDRNGATAHIRWSEVPDAQGYLLWRSPDGKTWSREEARYVEATSHRTFAFDGELFVRVTAVAAAGEGAPSNVLAVRTSDEGVAVLLVDGNDRYQLGPVPENPLGWGHDAITYHAQAFDGPFESVSHRLVEAGDSTLSDYERVLWMLGRESNLDETFTSGEQELLAAYLSGGGNLWVSGSEIGYDLIGQGDPEDRSFAENSLGIDYLADDAQTNLVTRGEASPAGVGLSRFSRLGKHEVSFPDVLAPAGGGQSCLRYARGVPGDACIVSQLPSGARVVVMGVPLESLDSPELARQLVGLLW